MIETTELRERNPVTDEDAERSGLGGGVPTRRQLLRQVAMAGAGVTGLTMLSHPAAAAGPPAENIQAVYTGFQNSYSANMRITSQTGNAFSGAFDDGTAISGTITGARPTFDFLRPMTIVFNRVLGDGTIQIFTGAVSVAPAGSDKDVLLAGVFYHDGNGPFPWFVQGRVIG